MEPYVQMKRVAVKKKYTPLFTLCSSDDIKTLNSQSNRIITEKEENLEVKEINEENKYKIDAAIIRRWISIKDSHNGKYQIKYIFDDDGMIKMMLSRINTTMIVPVYVKDSSDLFNIIEKKYNDYITIKDGKIFIEIRRILQPDADHKFFGKKSAESMVKAKFNHTYNVKCLIPISFRRKDTYIIICKCGKKFRANDSFIEKLGEIENNNSDTKLLNEVEEMSFKTDKYYSYTRNKSKSINVKEITIS